MSIKHGMRTLQRMQASPRLPSIQDITHAEQVAADLEKEITRAKRSDLIEPDVAVEWRRQARALLGDIRGRYRIRTRAATVDLVRKHALTDNCMLVDKLQAAGLDDGAIFAALSAFETTCPHCWDSDRGCQCRNDD